jgi:hypothetical protein
MASSTVHAVLNGIHTITSKSSTLSYMQSRTLYEDEIAIEDSGKFPYLNIDARDVRIVDADNIDKRTMERMIIPVVFIFGNRNVKKSLIKTGSVSFKSLFDIFDDLKTVIDSDRTFGKVVNARNYRPDFTSDVSQQSDGQFWIGRAAMIFEVYKDVFKK